MEEDRERGSVGEPLARERSGEASRSVGDGRGTIGGCRARSLPGPGIDARPGWNASEAAGLPLDE
ncbi:hypothetical protein MTE01_33650 [Microbacterium testaceum]|uniref:Uncharacterized protein n=1 Tax=Microbacterium testaceum TaxID=2033 RepID=A0A4Y3QTS0_MICTE|nr:hypothetical protein MTE01_33650 [Microbacterium testaceum]